MSKSKAAKVETQAVLPTEETTANFWNLILARDEEYPAKFRDATADMEFFDLLQELPDAVWENRFLIYIYRLDPVIRNKTGEKSYLVKVAYPIDEEWIRKTYGGGKYHLYLKDGRDTLKEAKPRLEGSPKLEEGQTINGSTATPPPAPAAAPGSEVAQAVEAASNAAKVQAEIMQHGFEKVMDLQTKVTEKSMGLNDAKTGGIDELVKLATALKALQPAENPLVTKLVEVALASMTKKENPEQPPQQELGGQLAIVKEIFGVDSLRDLGEIIQGKASKTETTPWYASMIGTALERLPGILQQFSEMQQQSFQRALTAHMMQNGQQPPPGTIIPPTGPQPVHPRMARVVTTPGPTVEAPPQNGAAKSLQEVVPLLINQIATGFDGGFEGWQTATAIDFNFPGVMDELKPMLGDAAALTQFVASIPVLAERSSKEEWPEFQASFLEYVNDNYGPEQAAPIVDGPKAVTAPGAA